MRAYSILEHLVRGPSHRRIAALIEMFPDAVRQDFVSPMGVSGTNLSIRFGRPDLILGAHHDLDPYTTQGAIDNTGSVSILAALALDLMDSGDVANLEINFWDLEEPGNRGYSDGATAYAERILSQGDSPRLAVVCDVLGIGVPWISTRSDGRSVELVSRAWDGPGSLRTVSTPYSDDLGLKRAGIKSALMTSLPENGSKDLWRFMHTRGDTIDLIDPAGLLACHEGLQKIVARYALNPELVEKLDLFGNGSLDQQSLAL
jgi:hypothetical protein